MTESNFPPPPQTPATVREWDRRAIEDFGIPGIVLMENAAAGAARCLLERPHAKTSHWMILCGPGNNGGDGFAVARYLFNAGCRVSLHLAFDPDTLRPGADNTVNFQIARALNLSMSRSFPETPHAADGVFIDALLGTGISRPLKSPYLEWVEAANASPCPIISLDLPTGLNAEAGSVEGAAVQAERTLTFAAEKIGFRRARGPSLIGRVDVIDIGLPRCLWLAGHGP